MPGWKNSNSTSRRLDRAFDRLVEAGAEVRDRGHEATSTPIAPESFFVRPPAVPPLVTFDDGVAAALRDHLTQQGLPSLKNLVDDLESIGRATRPSTDADLSVSAVVYQMH